MCFQSTYLVPLKNLLQALIIIAYIYLKTYVGMYTLLTVMSYMTRH